MVTSYRFLEGGPIALHGLVPFLNTTGPSFSKVVFADFDRISRVNIIYIYINYHYLHRSTMSWLMCFFLLNVHGNPCFPSLPESSVRAQGVESGGSDHFLIRLKFIYPPVSQQGDLIFETKGLKRKWKNHLEMEEFQLPCLISPLGIMIARGIKADSIKRNNILQDKLKIFERQWNPQICFSPPARWRLLDFIRIVLLLGLLSSSSSSSSAFSSSSASSSSFSSTMSASTCTSTSALPTLRQALCHLPTSQLSAHRWTSTWDLPSSVCTAGPQPGTFQAQCAPLDLNLGPSQLSVHRWTSTCDLPSSVCTAGPQPGTFPAQCAPLDLNRGPAQLSVHRWTSTWDLPSSVCTAGPQPGTFSSVCTAGPQRQDRMPDKMPWDMPEDMPDIMPWDMPDRMPEDMPEDTPDRMPEDMPGRMPEGMPDRMPEKCQIECHKICQIECQKICQIICQKICQIECQKECQKICQKICQIECQKICKNMCQKICQI